MATEPVARSRVVGGKEGEVFDGYALQRSCHGEQDEDFRAQTQHLLEQVYAAIELLERRWKRLGEHANYDRRKGQPVVVTVKDGKQRLPRRFKCRVHGAVPDVPDATVLVDVCWDGYSRGRKVPPENIAEGPGSTERIVFRLPPEIYPKFDTHIMKGLDRLRRAFEPCELDHLIAPAGRLSRGCAAGGIQLRASAAGPVARADYRPTRFGAGNKCKLTGVVNDAVKNAKHSTPSV
jgi:hypothetical protein